MNIKPAFLFACILSSPAQNLFMGDHSLKHPAPINRSMLMTYKYQNAYSQLNSYEQSLFLQVPVTNTSWQGALFLHQETAHTLGELYYGSQIHWIPKSAYRVGMEYAYSQQEYYQVHSWAAGTLAEIIPGLEFSAFFSERLNSQSSLSLIWQSMPSFSTENGWQRRGQKDQFFFKQNWQVAPLLCLQALIETNPLRMGLGIQFNSTWAQKHQIYTASQINFHPDLGSRWNGSLSWQKE